MDSAKKSFRMNIRQTLLPLFIFMLIFPGLQAATPAQKADALLAKMTLEEKVGQMTQVAIQMISSTRGTANQDHQLDQKKLREAVENYHVGSILNVWDKANTLDHWHEIITAIQDDAVKNTRLSIPVLYGIDAIHGANYTVGATLFPQSINMAATHDTSLIRQEGEITASEVRASGISWNFNPVLGLARQPAWPRFWETYGESEYIASMMGSTYIKAQQGNDPSAPDKIAACAKHYLGYSVPLSGHDRTPAWIPDRMLREYFLPPFKAAVDAGVLTFMLNSSEINGIPVHASKYYVTDILRDELGFDGLIVSDWRDIENLYTREKVAHSQKDAVRLAVEAGVDMSMVPLDYSFYTYLLELANEGTIPESRIDESVRRILTLKYKLGLFDNPYPNPRMEKEFATKDAEKVNLQAARESLVLLKNENNVLPLKKPSKVLVTGPTANMLSILNGGWSITWQGNQELLFPSEKKTILEAIHDKIGEKNVTYSPGVDFDGNIEINKTVELAKANDIAVVCVGETSYCETPGNIDDLTLDQNQLDLVKAIEESGTPVVLVLVEGRPRIIRPIVEDAQGILFAGLPGLEGGLAVADVLFGDYNPSGKLPFTYPKYPNDLLTYDYKNSEVSDVNTYAPQFPFGAGLSYTTFEYANLKLDKRSYSPEDNILTTVDIRNTGKKTGAEVVQLFLTDQVASITPSNRRLKRFMRVKLDPDETKTVKFALTPVDLSFIGRNNTRIIEPGKFTITVGTESVDFTLEGERTYSLQK